MPSLSLLLLGSFTCFWAGCGACPTCADSVLGILPVLLSYWFYLRTFLLTFPLFVSYIYIFYYVSLPNVSHGGLCILYK